VNSLNDGQEGEAINAINKKRRKKNIKNRITEAIKKIMKAIAVKIAIVLIPIFVLFVIVGVVLDLFDGGSNIVYAEGEFTEYQYGNNTGYWFPIAKEDIVASYFVGGNRENGLIAYTTKAEMGKTVISSPMGPRNRNTSSYYTITWDEYNQLSSSEKSKFARPEKTVEGDQHAGIDIGSSKVTSKEIIASKAGTVKIMGKTGGSYGNYLDITHNDGSVTRYAHLASITVGDGQTVQQGEVIGIMGGTGKTASSYSVHLHFEIRINGSPVDPLKYLDFSNPWPDPVTTSAR